MSEKASAKIVDGILVISLPDAINPIVWQMELGQSKASALEVRSSNDNTHVLTLKTPRQDVQEIAAYTNREGAIKALMTISGALERAGSQTEKGFVQNSCARPWSVRRIIMNLVLGLLTTIGLVVVVSNIVAFIFLGRGQPTASQNPADVQNKPVSADDFLEGR